jgi:hypothetical protein
MRLVLRSGLYADIIEQQWVGPNKDLIEDLNRLYPIDGSPAQGEPGSRAIMAAARGLGGRIEWDAEEPEPPGRVY